MKHLLVAASAALVARTRIAVPAAYSLLLGFAGSAAFALSPVQPISPPVLIDDANYTYVSYFENDAGDLVENPSAHNGSYRINFIWARINLSVANAGRYRIFVKCPPSNASSESRWYVNASSESRWYVYENTNDGYVATYVTLNMSEGTGDWRHLGDFDLGGSSTLSTSYIDDEYYDGWGWTPGRVVFDAVRIEPLDTPASSVGAPGNGPYVSDGGSFMIEAETSVSEWGGYYDEFPYWEYTLGKQSDPSGLLWNVKYDRSDAVNGYITTDASGFDYNPDPEDTATRTYFFNVETPGLYHFYVRRSATDWGSNSAYFTLQWGRYNETVQWIDNAAPNDGEWTWVYLGSQEMQTSIVRKRLDIGRRENGYAIDRIFVSTQPMPTGNGPAESLREFSYFWDGEGIIAEAEDADNAYVAAVDGELAYSDSFMPFSVQTNLAYGGGVGNPPFPLPSGPETYIVWNGDKFALDWAPNEGADGVAEYAFAAKPGNIRIGVRGEFPDGADNSFYYKLEPLDTEWRVFTAMSSEPGTFESYLLNTWHAQYAGIYRLKIHKRETGAKIESFTLDSELPPPPMQ